MCVATSIPYGLALLHMYVAHTLSAYCTYVLDFITMNTPCMSAPLSITSAAGMMCLAVYVLLDSTP